MMMMVFIINIIIIIVGCIVISMIWHR